MKHINFATGKTWEVDPTSMRLRTVERDIKRPITRDNFHIFQLGDAHAGNVAITIPTIEEAVRHVKRKRYGYVILHGDLFEVTDIRHPHFDLAIHGNRRALMNAQRELIEELLDPIATRIIGMVKGNHDVRMRNVYDQYPDLAKRWGCDYADGLFMKLIFPKWRMAVHHGVGSVRSMAGDLMQRHTNSLVMLKRRLRDLPVHDCEIVTCGHYHQLWVHPPDSSLVLVTDPVLNKLVHTYSEPGKVWIDREKGYYRIHESDRWYVCCGSFLRGYVEGVGTYSEEYAMGATELGYGHIEVRNGMPWKVETVPLGVGEDLPMVEEAV